MSAAFALDVADLWTRMVTAIATLGIVGLGLAWKDRHVLFTGTRAQVAIGLGSAAVLYAMTRIMASIEPFASQAMFIDTWRAGHSPAFLALTVTVAVAGEELFWRAAYLPLLRRRFEMVPAALLAAIVFAVVHVGSGTWLLPMAGLGAGFVWNMLYLATGNLTASFVSHLVWDLLIVVLAPPV
jgi:membrane protease YdiL (CAAX protease family)